MSDYDSQRGGTVWFITILVLLMFALSVMYFSRNNPDLANGGQALSSKPYPTNSRQPRVYTVSYSTGGFSPTNIRIHVGDTIRFQNDSKSPIRIVTDSFNGVPDLSGLDSVGEVQTGGIFTYTFNNSGIFGYHNAKNPSEEGTVIVKQ